MEERISKKYAQALFQWAKEKDKASDLYHELSTVAALMESDKSFAMFLRNPVIASKQKADLIETSFGKYLQPITMKSLLFLVHKRRINFLIEIVYALEGIYNQSENILQAKLTSSIELNKHQLSSLAQHLKLRLRKQVEVKESVDPKLLGGFKIQMDDRIYDFSISSQLKKIKLHILHAV